MDRSGLGQLAPPDRFELIHQRYRVHPAAKRDLEAISDRLVIERGADQGLEFIESTRLTFLRIGKQPGIGAPVRTRNSRLSGMRKRPVIGFPGILIFYQTEGGISSILRVFDARQDWWALLDVN